MITFKETPNEKKELDNILNPIVKEWFYSRFPSYSLPQLYGVYEIHTRQNILVSAPTGATKTLTGFLSILNELVDLASKDLLKDQVYAIYISPLKALNEDIKVNLLDPLKEIQKIASDKYGKEIDIRVAVRGGDTTQAEKTKMLKKPPHILITTPESLGILLSTIKFSQHLKHTQWMIIDEIHSLAEGKRGVHLAVSLERLEHFSGHITRVGLSATVSPLKEVAKYLVGPNRSCKIVNVQFIKDLDLEVISPLPNLIDTTYQDLHHKTYEILHHYIQDHKTTLIFTNTRAGTERVVHFLKERFPKYYTDANIGAHHGSLSKEHRHALESNLRKGVMKVAVCSTSLELGLDIGAIDLVICLGSPKSVARTLQRVGRAGHKLNAVTKGKIVVMNRDDLIECCMIQKYAKEKNIDRLHIPTGSLDVLAQQLLGAAIQEVWEEEALYKLVKNTYCYEHLTREDYDALLSYLSGDYASLEERNVYGKIWRKEGKIGKRGKMTRLIYMTNSGTIPSQGGVTVKIGSQRVGMIDEAFLERLRKRDVFVLGGSTYEFRHAKGMVAQVDVSIGKPPTVPSWASETLPLSFDLSRGIAKFRYLINQKFESGLKEKEILSFIKEHFYTNDTTAKAIYIYCKEQFDYALVPTEKKIVIEHYSDERGKKIIFLTMCGRRVNDALSRAIAYIISHLEKVDVEIGLNDGGFYIGCEKKPNMSLVMKTLTTSNLREILELSIEKTEVMKRRFRHCAERSLMILRNYQGRTKRVGKQQVLSTALINSVREISNDFPILKEARREVLEDLMDIENSEKIVTQIREETLEFTEITSLIPSPFSFELVLQGYSDVLKMDDRVSFLKRMHEMVLAKISLSKGKKGVYASELESDLAFSLPSVQTKTPDLSEKKVKRMKKGTVTSSSQDPTQSEEEDRLKYLLSEASMKSKTQKKMGEQLDTLTVQIPTSIKIELAKMILGKGYDLQLLKTLKKHKSTIVRKWPRLLADLISREIDKTFTYEELWDEREETQEKDSEEFKDLLLDQFRHVHHMIDLDALIYFELEKFIENPKQVYDKKFKKWLAEILTDPIPDLWPKQLIMYMKENQHLVK